MSSVPIVQGVAVDPNSKQQQQQPVVVQGIPNNNHDAYVDYGSAEQQQQQPLTGGMHAQQPNQFRDVIWAILFIGHFVPLAMYAIFSNSSSSDNDEQEGGGTALELQPHLFWLSTVALVSIGLASFSFGGMMSQAELLVKVSLVFSVFCSGLLGVFGLLSGQTLMAVLGFFSLAIGCCYAWAVWSRIPYAAANLRTALTAVRNNMGLVVISYVFMAVAFAWTCLFFLGFGHSMQQASYPILFCWLVSFYWVHQVLEYTVHVICAGVVATWWFNPAEASSFFSSALRDSTIRALTFSFGSICFGAFLVSIVRALRVTLQYARQNDDAQFLVCILECILRCIEDVIDYLNKWAYIYVGIYGFSYLEAGREVFNLFQNKGWTVIITDDLVDNVLFMISVAIGLVSGTLAYFMGTDALENAGVQDESGMAAGMTAFGIGFLMGLLLSTIALSPVASAVNTVIVCYAEAPAEFQANHPQLASEMRAAWTGAWPELAFGSGPRNTVSGGQIA